MIYFKMNGCGNEFAILDARRADKPFAPDAAQVRRLAAPGTRTACDQLIVMDAPQNADADIAMRIWNADGGAVEACGNATRCVGWLLMREGATPPVRIRTKAGLLLAQGGAGGQICVDMGRPRLGWEDIPLAERMDTRGIDIKVGPIDAPVLAFPGAVNMGNPHAVFFVDDAAAVAVETLGSMLEHHPLFPERANIGFAQIIGPKEIRLRVWERGTGLTKACGTGACAALVAAHRRGLVGRKAALVLDGGVLTVEWRETDDHVLMSGPVALEYEGVIDTANV